MITKTTLILSMVFSFLTGAWAVIYVAYWAQKKEHEKNTGEKVTFIEWLKEE